MRFYFFLIALLVFTGCNSKKDQVRTPKVLEKKTEALSEKKLKPKIPERIFGLPVPPNAFSHFTLGDDEAVLIKTKLATLKYFYQKNLVDFEVVEQDGNIFIVGLRSYMASAKISPYTNAGNAPLIIKFSAAKTKFEKEEILAKDPRTKGTEVKLRTKTGELIAPGARWGEPYTPPFGTPLHKERYRLMWGKPFGEWKAQ